MELERSVDGLEQGGLLGAGERFDALQAAQDLSAGLAGFCGLAGRLQELEANP
jgi:hypothetical protein